MKDSHVISQSPSKTNIAYSVLYMGNDNPIEEYFQWLVDEITEEKIKATRTIIYCQTIKQCGTIYSTLRGMLGDKLYANITARYKMGAQICIFFFSYHDQIKTIK